MKKYTLAALLAVVFITLASCGNNAGGSGGTQGGAQATNQQDGDTQATQQAPTKETTGGNTDGMDEMEGMNNGEPGSAQMAETSRQMVMPNGEYSDRAFIDAMVPHHEGAVDMAQVALKRAEHPQISNLAEEIVSAQRSEVELFGKIREREYGSAESAAEMNDQDMEAMGMSDTRKLAQADPFDKAFLDEMIPHHESAIAMAEVARQETKNPEIRDIAAGIVGAQEKEIAQMKQWRQQWYPEG
ncbi:MAG: DUF305 domain-containing protein [Rubrobacteraceae bacterium]